MISKIALRDLKNSKKFNAIFLITLFLGIFGFVIINSTKNSINSSLKARAKNLLTGDLAISGRVKPNEEQLIKIRTVLGKLDAQESQLISLYSMGRFNRRSRLLNIKAVQSNYPFYGELVGKKGSFSSTSGSFKALLSKDVLYQLKAQVGDEIELGNKKFKIVDEIVDDTSISFGGLGLAATLYIAKDDLADTKLLGFGSLANYTYIWKFKKKNSNVDLKNLKSTIDEIVSNPAIRVTLPNNSSEQVGRVLNYLSDFLGLVSVVALFLSSIGALYLFQNYILARVIDIAILKSLGLKKTAIYQIFIFQMFMLSFFAVVAALSCSSLLLPFIGSYLSDYLNSQFIVGVDLQTSVVAFCVGFFSLFLVCIPILAQLLNMPTNALLSGRDNIKWNWKLTQRLRFLPFFVFFYSLAVWQAHSIVIGTTFFVILVICVLFGYCAVSIVSSFGNKYFHKYPSLGKPFSLAFGLSLRAISRNKVSTAMSFISLTIGILLINLISLIEFGINKEISFNAAGKPTLFLFDIQQEQVEELRDFAKIQNIQIDNLTPMVRARLSKINGELFKKNKEQSEFVTREEQRAQRFRNRGINLTYGNSINKSQKIIEGNQFTKDNKKEVSLEHRYAKRLGLKIGDKLTFNILGVDFDVVVTSLRKIRWTTFLPNFFITMEEGIIEDAPQTYLASLYRNNTNYLEQQDLIIEKFPNISIVNVQDIVSKISAIFKTMSISIGIMGLLCVCVGLFVIFSIIQNQMSENATDIAIQKSFGVDSKIIRKTYLLEYFILSVSSALTGSLFSVASGYFIASQFFDGIWSTSYFRIFLIILIVLLSTSLIVWLTIRTNFNKKVRSLIQ